MNFKNNAKKFFDILAWIFLVPLTLAIFVLLLPVMRLDKVVRKRKNVKPRILFGPYPNIHASINSLADRKHGFQSDSLVYKTYYITADFTYNLEKYFRFPILYSVLPYFVFIWASMHYDIFQFYYRGGFLLRKPGSKLELPLLRLAGKEIVVQASGSDVRQEDVTRKLGKYNAYTDYTHEEIMEMMSRTDKEIRTDIAHVFRFANVCLSMGDMTEYTPGSRNDVYYWGIDVSKVPFIGVRENRIIKVVHAPNHPKYKGTKYLVEAAENLKKKGLPLELQLVQKVPNKEALEIYKTADIIADQFLIGWHGTFAVEAMALGKPVLCFIRKKTYLPDWADCPIVNTNPDNLEENMEKLVRDYDLRRRLGEQGRAYVEKVFSLDVVSRKMAEIYDKIW